MFVGSESQNATGGAEQETPSVHVSHREETCPRLKLGEGSSEPRRAAAKLLLESGFGSELPLVASCKDGKPGFSGGRLEQNRRSSLPHIVMISP